METIRSYHNKQVNKMKKIKVLWFSNTPAAGDEYISSNSTGGWLKSLDKAIPNIQSSRACFVISIRKAFDNIIA